MSSDDGDEEYYDYDEDDDDYYYDYDGSSRRKREISAANIGSRDSDPDHVMDLRSKSVAHNIPRKKRDFR